MKIEIKETVTKEKEVPPYFKHLNTYYMCVGTKSLVIVKDHHVQESVTLFPEIRIDSIKYFSPYLDYPIEPVSEAEFKNAYIKATLEIEKMMN